MNDSCEVIILSTKEYKENDALVSALSLKYGYQTFIAKGLNKADSRNRSACLPYSISQFMFDYKETGLQLLHSASLVKSYHSIQDDLAKMTVMSVISEMIEFLVKDNTYDDELIQEAYLNYGSILDRMANTDKYAHLLGYTFSFIYRMLGIDPIVDECAICGDTKVSSISLSEGGFICYKCQKTILSPIYPLEFLMDFRIINKLTLDKLDKYLNYNMPSRTMIDFLYEYFVFHSSQTLKSWVFIDKWAIIK